MLCQRGRQAVWKLTLPFYFKNKIYYINKKQVSEISDIIKKYYTYNFVEKGQLKYKLNLNILQKLLQI